MKAVLSKIFGPASFHFTFLYKSRLLFTHVIISGWEREGKGEFYSILGLAKYKQTEYK